MCSRVEDSLHQDDGAAADRARADPPFGNIEAERNQAGTPHFDPLLDDVSMTAVGRSRKLLQDAAESRRRRAGRRILVDAEFGREHAGAKMVRLGGWLIAIGEDGSATVLAESLAPSAPLG